MVAEVREYTPQALARLLVEVLRAQLVVFFLFQQAQSPPRRAVSRGVGVSRCGREAASAVAAAERQLGWHSRLCALLVRLALDRIAQVVAHLFLADKPAAVGAVCRRRRAAVTGGKPLFAVGALSTQSYSHLDN